MMENQNRKNHASKGFSLVELIIVIAIIAIVAGIAIPGFKQYTKSSNFRTAVNDIAADIQKAKSLAVSQSFSSYRLTFDTGANSYSLIRTDTNVTVWPPKKPSDFEPGIELTSANFSGSPFIVFHSRGTTTIGNIKLKNDAGKTAKITINITGRTYVQIPSPD
jgi:prepilin-type N-terminal cleavage/methylation domain-containing protein